MLRSTLIPSVTKATTTAAVEQHEAVATATQPTEPSRAVGDDPPPPPVGVHECIQEAIRRCHGEMEQAIFSQEPGMLQRGLEAEEIVKLLGRLVDLRWSTVLQAEIHSSSNVGISNDQGLMDVRQRMDMSSSLSWKKSLVTKLAKAEVHIKRFVETLMESPNYSPAPSSPAPPNGHKLQSPTEEVKSMSVEEGIIVNDTVVGEPVPPPCQSNLMPMVSSCDSFGATINHLHHINNNNSNNSNTFLSKHHAPPTTIVSPPTDGLDEEGTRHDASHLAPPPDALTRIAAHRKLKPPKFGRIVATTLTDLDVPRGRGGVINRHPGHQYLLSRVCSYRVPYKAAKRGEKETLAKQLVREIQNRNGRFLDYLVGTDGNKTWYEIDDEAAIKVVQQKLRELPVRVKDKWRDTTATTASDTDDGSGELDEGDAAGYRPDDARSLLTTSKKATPDSNSVHKGKGERETAMMLLSL